MERERGRVHRKVKFTTSTRPAAYSGDASEVMVKRILVLGAAVLLAACSGEESPDPVEAAFAEASEAYARGDLAGSESSLRGILVADSLNPDAWHNLGVVLLEQGRYDESVSAIERALELDPGRPGMYALLCGAQVGCGEIREALASGERAVSSDPSDATAFNNLGRAYMEAGMYSDAAACFTTAIRRTPSNPAPHYNLACLYVMAGDPGSALPLLEEAIALSPAYPGARTQLAVVHGMLGHFEEAGHEAQMALAQNPLDLMAMNCLALSLQSRGMHEQAVEVYKDMLPLVTDSTGRALLLVRMGE